MKKYGLLLIVLFLVSCSTTKRAEPQARTVYKIEQESLPAWLYELPPQGDFVIGIAFRSFDVDAMKEDAKQRAAIIHSRNKASYAISKSASRSTDNFLMDGRAKFTLNVSIPEETMAIYEQLKLVDDYIFNEYFLGLYTQTEQTLPEQYKVYQSLPLPQWCSQTGLVVEGDVIRYYISESSADLVSAWGRASETARLKIAEYLEIRIQSDVTSIDDRTKKDIALETRKKINDLIIQRSYITSQMRDNLRSYKVYMEMRTK